MQKQNQKQHNYFRSELKSKNIPKYKIIGINTEIILDEEVFKRNEEIRPFLEAIFNLKFKDYIMKSRTLIIARTSREIYKLDIKETDIVRRKLLIFINNILSTQNVNSNSLNSKQDFTKWMDGISDVED